MHFVFDSPTPNGSSDTVTSQMQGTVNQTAPPSALLRYPPEQIEFGTLFRFVKYSYDNQLTNTKFITSMSGASIALPLPRELAMSLGLAYAAVDSGVLGYAAKVGSTLADYGSAAQMVSAGEEVAKELKGVSHAAEDIATYILRKMAAEHFAGIENVANQLLGNVVNPYNVATFQHTQSRAYRLTFSLIPASKADNDLIKKICDAFMYHSLPYSTNTQSPSATPPELYLKMPDEVEIAFYGSEYLYTFARAIIDNVSINYAPHGEPSFFGETKAPTAVELSLSIREIQQLSRTAFDTQAGGFTDPTPTANTDDTIFQGSNLGQGQVNQVNTGT